MRSTCANVKALSAGKDDVGDKHLAIAFGKGETHRSKVRHGPHLMPRLLQRLAHHGADRRVIIDDQNLAGAHLRGSRRSEEHTSELQSLMRISYAAFCLKKTTTP